MLQFRSKVNRKVGMNKRIIIFDSLDFPGKDGIMPIVKFETNEVYNYGRLPEKKTQRRI